MKQIFLVMACVLAGCFAAGAQQDAKYEAALNKAVYLSCDRTMLVETFEGNFKSFVENGTLTTEKWHAMSEEMAEWIYPFTVEATKNLWRQELTYDDLIKVTEWLSSPTGHKVQRLSGKTGELTQKLLGDPEYRQQMMEIVSKYIK